MHSKIKETFINFVQNTFGQINSFATYNPSIITAFNLLNYALGQTTFNKNASLQQSAYEILHKTKNTPTFRRRTFCLYRACSVPGCLSSSI